MLKTPNLKAEGSRVKAERLNLPRWHADAWELGFKVARSKAVRVNSMAKAGENDLEKVSCPSSSRNFQGFLVGRIGLVPPRIDVVMSGTRQIGGGKDETDDKRFRDI